MTTTLIVSPGIDMGDALRRETGGKLTKAWLRDYLRGNPQKDFRIVGGPGPLGSYVNGEDAIRHDLSLEVRMPNGHVAVVDYQSCPVTDRNEWGYQAVVR